MPIGTAVHEKTLALCESLNYRDWSGYYAVSAYETHHEHEYNAIRNAAALIDVSPLYKYRLSGPDATRLVDRIVTRDMRKVSVGQVIYTPWCDEQGKAIDDGTVSRLEENVYRWTAADPSLRWFQQNALGLDVADRGHLRAGRLARAPGPDVRPAAQARRRGADREPEVLPRHEGKDRRRAGRDLAHGIHRRPRLRDLDPVERRRKRLRRAHGRRPRLRYPPGGHARPGRGAHRSRPAADRRGLPEQQEGDDREPEILALRDGASPSRGPRQGEVRRAARAA